MRPEWGEGGVGRWTVDGGFVEAGKEAGYAAGPQIMETLGAGQELRSAAAGRHQCGQETDNVSLGATGGCVCVLGGGLASGYTVRVAWQEGGRAQGRNQKGMWVLEQGLARAICEEGSGSRMPGAPAA